MTIGRPPKPRKPCTVTGCERPRFGHGYCNAHYKRWRKNGDPGKGEIFDSSVQNFCTVLTCGRLVVARGLCSGHYARWSSTGEWPTTLLRTMGPYGKSRPCSRPGCDRFGGGCGYCIRHNGRLKLFVDAYGMSGWDEFDALWEATEGRCGICRKPLDQDGKDTHVDHSHLTGKVRGILCGKCNIGIGHFDDDVERMADAITYLNAARQLQAA